MLLIVYDNKVSFEFIQGIHVRTFLKRSLVFITRFILVCYAVGWLVVLCMLRSWFGFFWQSWLLPWVYCIEATGAGGIDCSS